MLEQLQRLQAHITKLHTHLSEVERNNQSLLQQIDSSEEQHHAQIVHKNSIITQKQDELESLNDQHTQLQAQFKTLNTDATALAER